MPIRNVGTGNPGTANVFREMSARYAALVLVLDFLKGSASMLPAFLFDVDDWAGAVGAASVLMGHYLPVFWRFRGGTGMVVAIGVCLSLNPVGALVGIPVGLIALGLSKNPALSGTAFFVTAGAAGWWVSSSPVPAALVTLAAGSVLVKSCTQYGWLSSTSRDEVCG